MFKFILIFSLCSLVNVMLNTVKTIVMYRNEKISSATINAITYGFYTVIVVLMAGEMPLYLKIIITAATNFIGVYLSMMIMDKLRKDKLWKIEATIPSSEVERMELACVHYNISHSRIEVDPLHTHTLFIFYCPTQKHSAVVREMLKDYDAKYFVSESKNL